MERKPGANLRSDEQEHHIRRSLKASWHKTTKPCGLTGSVNDALVQGKFMSLSGEICLTGDRNYPLRPGYKPVSALHHGHQVEASESMTNDSASGGNTTGD